MRNLSFKRLLLAGTLALGAALAHAQHQQITLTRIGPVVEVEGLDGSRPKFEAVNGNEVYENDLVVTSGENSRVILVFSNGATINVGEDSQVEIRQFFQDPFAGEFSFAEATSEPEGSISRTQIHLSQGELIGNVKSLNEGSTFDISTPAGAAGIRGTTFRIVFRPGGDGTAFFSVTTIEGNVVVDIPGAGLEGDIPVSDLQEVEILVEVDDDTGEVTAVTVVDGGTTKAADPAVVAVVTEVVQEAAEEVATVILTESTPPAQGGTNPTDTGGNDDNDGSDDPPQNDQDQQQQPQTQNTDAQTRTDPPSPTAGGSG